MEYWIIHALLLSPTQIGLKVLGYDRKSDMTSKYGTIYFIIICYYKWEDFEIEADR